MICQAAVQIFIVVFYKTGNPCFSYYRRAACQRATSREACGSKAACGSWGGIIIIVAAKKFPKYINEDDRAEGKNILKWFGIIFGIEGAAMPIACLILALWGETQIMLPVIALIVGLHFYPMAKIFRRTMDYYLATWTCIVAVAGILMIVKYNYPPPLAFTYMGVGVALSTTTYGLYMLCQGYSFIKKRNGR